MGESNTPPVSPRDPTMDEESDDEIPAEGDAFEVYELDDEEFEEEIEDEEGQEMVEEEIDVPDDSVCVFKKHEGSVFCCNFEPKEGKLAVSGGEDDKAYVWKVENGEVLFECGNHRDSVIHAQFSHDGVYVATADMAGFIQVWKVATNAVVWSFEMGDLSWIDWHSASHVLFAGALDGETWMWKVPSGDCKTFAGHGERNECGKLLPDGRRMAVGYLDGSTKIFDLKSGSVLQQFNGSHSNAVTSIDCHRDNNLIATGCLDATAKLYNTQAGRVLATLSCDASGSEEAGNSVEAVTFCPDPVLSLLVTGSLTGRIGFWDIPSQVERQFFDQKAGVVKMVWHPKNPHWLLTAGLDGTVRLIDARNGQLVRQFTGHRANILDLAVSSDGSHILTSSDDQTCRVFLTDGAGVDDASAAPVGRP